MAKMDGKVNGHVGNIARSERGVCRNEAQHSRLTLKCLREFHRLRPQTDGELEADGFRAPAANHLEQFCDVAHGGSRHTRGLG